MLLKIIHTLDNKIAWKMNYKSRIMFSRSRLALCVSSLFAKVRCNVPAQWLLLFQNIAETKFGESTCGILVHLGLWIWSFKINFIAENEPSSIVEYRSGVLYVRSCLCVGLSVWLRYLWESLRKQCNTRRQLVSREWGLQMLKQYSKKNIDQSNRINILCYVLHFTMSSFNFKYMPSSHYFNRTNNGTFSKLHRDCVTCYIKKSS